MIVFTFAELHAKKHSGIRETLLYSRVIPTTPELPYLQWLPRATFRMCFGHVFAPRKHDAKFTQFALDCLNANNRSDKRETLRVKPPPPSPKPAAMVGILGRHMSHATRAGGTLLKSIHFSCIFKQRHNAS